MDNSALFAEHEAWAQAIAKHFWRLMPEDAQRRLSSAACEQCALIGLWEASQRFDPERGTFKGFAGKRIKGEMRSELMRTRFVPGETLPAERIGRRASNPIQICSDREESQRILRMVPRKPGWRTVVRLTAEGYSAVEIAQRMGLSRRWVQIILQRARARVKAKFRASVGP